MNKPGLIRALADLTAPYRDHYSLVFVDDL
jgi:hypothetical protein